MMEIVVKGKYQTSSNFIHPCLTIFPGHPNAGVDGSPASATPSISVPPAFIAFLADLSDRVHLSPEQVRCFPSIREDFCLNA